MTAPNWLPDAAVRALYPKVRNLSPFPIHPGMGQLPCATDRPFPQWLRAARLERGLSLRELSVLTRLSKSYLSGLERDTPNCGTTREPSPAVVARLRLALGAGE
jgi:hypothetical protein